MTAKKIFDYVFEIAKIVSLALVIVIPIRYFVFQPFIVYGSSMEPNFRNGDYVIVDELSYRLGNPKRGDVIIFKFPEDPSKKFIKRVIGLPNEEVKIQGTKLVIFDKNGKEIDLNEASYLPKNSWLGNEDVKLGKDEYFVMGDNRPFSYDSRRWGVLPRKDILGKVVMKFFPPFGLKFVPTPSYQ